MLKDLEPNVMRSTACSKNQKGLLYGEDLLEGKFRINHIHLVITQELLVLAPDFKKCSKIRARPNHTAQPADVIK